MLHFIYYHMVCIRWRLDQIILKHCAAAGAGAGKVRLIKTIVRIPIHAHAYTVDQIAAQSARITVRFSGVAMAMVQRTANRFEYRFAEYCHLLATQILCFRSIAMFKVGLLLDAVLSAFVALAVVML